MRQGVLAADSPQPQVRGNSFRAYGPQSAVQIGVDPTWREGSSGTASPVLATVLAATDAIAATPVMPLFPTTTSRRGRASPPNSREHRPRAPPLSHPAAGTRPVRAPAARTHFARGPSAASAAFVSNHHHRYDPTHHPTRVTRRPVEFPCPRGLRLGRRPGFSSRRGRLLRPALRVSRRRVVAVIAVPLGLDKPLLVLKRRRRRDRPRLDRHLVTVPGRWPLVRYMLYKLNPQLRGV